MTDKLNYIDTMLNNEIFKHNILLMGKENKSGNLIGITFGFTKKINQIMIVFSKNVFIVNAEKFPSFEIIGISKIFKP